MAAKRARKGGAGAEVALYEMTYSHYCAKVRKLLDHKGVGYRRVEVPYHDKRELLRVSGQDYVPWLEWDGEGMPWYDIVEFLEARVPEPTAFPPGLKGQAQLLEQWAHDILEERVWRYVLPEFPATFKDEHERWVFEELQERKRGPLAEYQAKQPKHLEDLKKHLALLETALDGHDHLLGEAPSLADFAVFGALYPLQHVGREVPKEFPRLRAWHQRVAKA